MGIRYTTGLTELARQHGLDRRTLESRRRRGWSWRRALSTPAAPQPEAARRAAIERHTIDWSAVQRETRALRPREV